MNDSPLLVRSTEWFNLDPELQVTHDTDEDECLLATSDPALAKMFQIRFAQEPILRGTEGAVLFFFSFDPDQDPEVKDYLMDLVAVGTLDEPYSAETITAVRTP